MKIEIANKEFGMAEIAAWTGGRLVVCGADVFSAEYKLRGVCTDSREAGTGVLFCAIRGERVDGHDYMKSAYDKGTRLFICEKIPVMLTGAYIAVVVDNTVYALSRIASAVRKEYLTDMKSVAITGSVGKTTTKECVAAVLAEGERVFKKDGNFNSLIGLPLSMLEIPSDEKLAVLEMGMSELEEIHRMSVCLAPDIAIITNIGSSHLEHLGSRENIARAKLEIRDGLCDGGVLLIDGDEPLLQNLRANRFKIMRVSVGGGAAKADFKALNVDTAQGGMRFDLLHNDGILEDMFIPGYGVHLVWAAAYACAVGLIRNMKEEDIRRGLANYRPAEMRQSIVKVGGVTMIEDCYNAAPESMMAALSALMCVAEGRRIAVLGDMLELGEQSIDLHRTVGEKYASVGVDMLVTVGELGEYIAEGAIARGLPQCRVESCQTSDNHAYSELAKKLYSQLIPGDTVLFKASRGIRLERLAAELKSLMENKSLEKM